MVRFGLDNVENVSRSLKVVEVLVEVGALGEKGVKFDIKGSLVSDALVEETRHRSDIGKGADMIEGLGSPEFDTGCGGIVMLVHWFGCFGDRPERGR